MATWFCHGDPRYPFLWETGPQPAARWHGPKDGPVTYLADTPDGAWAEFLRHEEITDPADLRGVTRRMWAVEVPDTVLTDAPRARLSTDVLTGDPESYAACRAHALELRRRGAQALVAPSAALQAGGARGERVSSGVHGAEERDGQVLALFGGVWTDVRAWAAVDVGAPTPRQLSLVRHFRSRSSAPARG